VRALIERGTGWLAAARDRARMRDWRGWRGSRPWLRGTFAAVLLFLALW